MMIKAVILDDEPRGSALLQHKLMSFSSILSVEKIYSDPLLALEAVRQMPPDVLFLDVEMPTMNGLQFLENLGQFEFEVIFVTAYNAYTLDALRANALDYLLKPVDPEELGKAIEKLQKSQNGSSYTQSWHYKIRMVIIKNSPPQPRKLELLAGA